MILDVLFFGLSIVAIVMGVIRVVNYDLAFKIEVAIKQAVKMRLPERSHDWEVSSRFTGILLVVLGALNLISLLSR